VQLIAAQVLGAGRIRRAAQVPREMPDGTDVAALRPRCELAQPHVFDHALTQRRNAPSRGVHGSAPVTMRGGSPHLATYETEPQDSASHRTRIEATLPRERFSPLAACRRPRVSAIPPSRPTFPLADAQR
jgi:hypothetical protein